uniref:Uncharacterized protein n=1 Tax=Avena sativa TaxID=4498 RepID=A0ACD5V6F1_AVESA
MATPAPHLVDEILEEIFLRLPTPAALARASTASPRFGRIITERSFLRRFRKRHPPPLLGFADGKGFHPAQAPHPSSALASALAAAADFTYSFVPKPSKGGWMPSDVRDGRVLLEEDSPGWKKFSNLAVCDPLSRRHRLLPPVPEELTGARKEHPCEIIPILAPIGEEDEDQTSFKVICMANYETELVAFVFSSLTEQWCIAASPSWSSLGMVRPLGPRMLSFYVCRGFSSLDNVRGCFYWASPWMDKLLLLNTKRMEFSIVNNRTGYHLHLRSLPCQADEVLARNDMAWPGQARSLPRIIVGKEGAIEMFSLVGDHSPHGSFNLYHTTQQNDCESSKGWQLENIIPLPSQYDYFTLGAAEGFLFLGATTEDQLYIEDHSPVWLSKTDWDVDYFSLDVKTSELAKVCRRKRQFFHSEHVYWYFGFPPSLSKPSI